MSSKEKEKTFLTMSHNAPGSMFIQVFLTGNGLRDSAPSTKSRAPSAFLAYLSLQVIDPTADRCGIGMQSF